MRVLVTGASGFVGLPLLSVLEHGGMQPRAALRRSGSLGERAFEAVVVGELGAETEWSSALADVDAVVHLAARVHVLRDTAADPLTEFRRVNTAGTLNLARQAAMAGARRFVFISSIKVNGEGCDMPYSERDAPEPEDAYGLSKLEAEQGLHEIARETDLEVVILRPPLVYGPGVKANFLKLMRVVDAGWPLPLGAACNRRSLLYLGNLLDAIQLCLSHPAAAGQTFLLSDGAPLSSADLVRAVAAALGRPARLMSVPPGMLRLMARTLGQGAVLERLLGSLVLDDRLIRERLGWQPSFDLEGGLAETAAAYRRTLGSDRVTER